MFLFFPWCTMIWVSEHSILHPFAFILNSVCVPQTRVPCQSNSVCMRGWCTKYKVPLWGSASAGVLQINLKLGKLHLSTLSELSAPMYTCTLHPTCFLCVQRLTFCVWICADGDGGGGGDGVGGNGGGGSCSGGESGAFTGFGTCQSVSLHSR